MNNETTHTGLPSMRHGRFLLALAMAIFLGMGSAAAQDELFVANSGNDSISVYARTAGGNAVPLRIISGPATKLDSPLGVAVDTVNNEIVVTNGGRFADVGSASITVYPLSANGNVAPLRTIAGASSGLDENNASPVGVAVDPLHGEIFVSVGDGVSVWSRTASGNVAPLRSIATVGSGSPQGIALDMTNDELLVSHVQSIIVFARTASGNATPLRTIAGAAAQLGIAAGIALDVVHDEVAVVEFNGANSNDGNATVFARSANGNVAPLRAIEGPATGIRNPIGVAIDPVHDEIFVSNPNNGPSVTVHARTANGNVAPLRTLVGPATGLSGNYYIALRLALTSHDHVQRAYVAYYGRPADPAGQDYWADRMDAEGGSLDAIIAAFGNSEEFNRRYGGLGYPALVTKIYQQALGRAPDQGGLDYYVGELVAGHRTLQTITLDVLNGATTPPDSIVIASKLLVAAYYTAKVRTGCPYGTEQDGVNILSGVTADQATVAAAKAAIDGRCTS